MCGQAQQLHKGKPCVVQVRRRKALCVSCAEKGPVKSTGETSSMNQVFLLSWHYTGILSNMSLIFQLH